MEPFNYLEDAEIWMDENTVGTICVLVKNPPPWRDVNTPPSRWELEREAGIKIYIDISHSRIQQLINDQLSPLRAVHNYVSVFFNYPDRVSIKHIRMSNEVYQPTSTSDRPKRSKRKKQAR